MSVFKKLTKGKDKSKCEPLPEPEPVKQIDPKVGLDTYRFVFFWLSERLPDAMGSSNVVLRR